MSTVRRPRIVLADILFCLFVFVMSISVLFAYDVGLIGFKDISSTFLRPSSPSPPPSYPSTVLDSGHYYHGDLTALDKFKVPACVTLLILMLLTVFYLRNIYGHRFTPNCYQSSNQCVAQVRLSLLLQHKEVLANGLQKATEDVQKATAHVKQEQAMSKFHREMVEAAYRKYVELQTASAEALRLSSNELGESKQSVVRLNTLVNHLRQDLEHSAKQHKRDVKAADRNRLKAIAIARYAQAEANALRSEAVSARLELDAMRIEVDLVRRELRASKRRARAARQEAGASDTENASLRSALAASRKEVSTVRKGAKGLIAELQAQKASN
ncbi:hypothetical protein FRC04_009606 [Tulasnella sp. 424]|nr:hypothetical protein FRC04_009606 [Tulasnella sp. 424]KAG8975905.1 hypothetical protein FRC05_004836 [Tulasnella sp. 425]